LHFCWSGCTATLDNCYQFWCWCRWLQLPLCWECSGLGNVQLLVWMVGSMVMLCAAVVSPGASCAVVHHWSPRALWQAALSCICGWLVCAGLQLWHTCATQLYTQTACSSFCKLNALFTAAQHRNLSETEGCAHGRAVVNECHCTRTQLVVSGNCIELLSMLPMPTSGCGVSKAAGS
jgi:hypothetical protein